MAETDVELSDKGTPETSIASSIIPYSRDTEEARWLGYRACGFSIREALQMVDRSKTWLSLQRRNPIWVDLETRIPEFRRELSKEYTEIEFFRNFRLVLEKDHRVLQATLFPKKMSVTLSDGTTQEVDTPMSKQDHEYLIKLRSQYTPQQLQILEAIVSGGGDGFNFAKWVSENQEIVQMSRTDTVTMARKSEDA